MSLISPPMDTSFVGLLPPARPRRKYFVASFAGQAVALALVIKFGVVDVKTFDSPRTYQLTELTAPVIDRAAQATPPVRITAPPVARIRQVQTVARIPSPPQPQPLPPQIVTNPPVSHEQLNAPRILPGVLPPAVAMAPAPVARREVQTGTFPGSSAIATTDLPAAKVQTGGFGDPNGLPSDAAAHGGLKIARVGSFDLPAGSGQGNGTGGAQASRATVASAGFGNGVAGPGQGANGASGQIVRESGFGAVTTAAPALRRVATVQPPLTPAEIVAKPQPSYTPEARANRVEGEVVLQVVFGANGKLRVMRVLRGLGYGLDESAVQAAQQIRFKPAQRNGQPVDSTARIHITFQLA